MQYFDFFHFIQVFFKYKNKMKNSPRTPKTPNTRKKLGYLRNKDVLNRIVKGDSYRKIKEEFGCSREQISTIKKSKRKINEAIEDSEKPNRQRLMVRQTAKYDKCSHVEMGFKKCVR